MVQAFVMVTAGIRAVQKVGFLLCWKFHNFFFHPKWGKNSLFIFINFLKFFLGLNWWFWFLGFSYYKRVCLLNFKQWAKNLLYKVIMFYSKNIKNFCFKSIQIFCSNILIHRALSKVKHLYGLPFCNEEQVHNKFSDQFQFEMWENTETMLTSCFVS